MHWSAYECLWLYPESDSLPFSVYILSFPPSSAILEEKEFSPGPYNLLSPFSLFFPGVTNSKKCKSPLLSKNLVSFHGYLGHVFL